MKPKGMILCVVYAAVAVCATGCVVPSSGGSKSATQADRQQPIGPGQVTPSQIQSKLMAYTDTYAAVMSQVGDQLMADAETIDERRLAIMLKLGTISNAVAIASGANPVTSLLDMTVMVSLQKEVWRDYWSSEIGDKEYVQTAIDLMYGEIWQVTELVLTEEEISALHELVERMRERFPDQVYVSTLRASEFAADRQEVVISVKGGGSLLTVFALDPLAGLNPTTRELARSRILGERAFFYAKRMPTLINWNIEMLVLEMLAMPEIVATLEAAVVAADAGERAATVAEGLTADLSAEREAAIDQIFEGVAAEREAIISRLEENEERVTAALGELRGTVEASGVLSDSLQTTLVAADTVFQRMLEMKAASNPDVRPFDITEYQSAVESATATVQELNAALTTAGDLLSSPDWDERGGEIRAAAAEGRAGVESLIDRAYRRGMMLVGASALSLLIVLVAYRFVAVRVIRSV